MSIIIFNVDVRRTYFFGIASILIKISENVIMFSSFTPKEFQRVPRSRSLKNIHVGKATKFQH